MKINIISEGEDAELDRLANSCGSMFDDICICDKERNHEDLHQCASKSTCADVSWTTEQEDPPWGTNV